MSERYLTVGLEDILVGEPLPGSLFLYLDMRFVTFRATDAVIDRDTYERLELKRVKYLFILERDRETFEEWSLKLDSELPPALTQETKNFNATREDVHRKTMDIFQSNHPEKIVAETLEASKKLVDEVMKFPFAVSTLSQLQNYSRGMVDHSVNVSVLSVYLAMQMGYSHTVILQHVGMGGLLHDIGKTQVQLKDDDDATVMDTKIRAHPEAGVKLIESQQKVPNEVKMIIAQHHECYDGSGFPKKMRGNNIYDLARIVSIANIFDELVGDGRGTLVERQRTAITRLDKDLAHKFDPQKLEKALKILRLGV
jgi:putative nucleotidyltransferase with HDIG domain